jgi:antitoxin component YwqK of YwqJK toxin-antitoxin module
MRYRLFIILILFYYSLKGQTIEYWIYDTLNVNLLYDNAAIIPDTVANLKLSLEKQNAERAIIYWDKEKKHKYTELTIDRQDTVITYYRNGQINEINYNGYKQGYQPNDRSFWAAWYPDGKKKVEQIFLEKKRTTFYYFHSGKVRRKDIEIYGLSIDFPDIYGYAYKEEYCENGQLITKDSVNSTVIRDRISYHCNGKQSRKFTTNGANNFGKWQEWYPNGKISVDGQYDREIPKDSLGYFGVSKMQGSWKYYEDNGKLIKVDKYQDGVIIETTK